MLIDSSIHRPIERTLMSTHRSATHSGTWYSSNSGVLIQQIDSWFHSAVLPDTVTNNIQLCHGILSPHAGYTYSGPTAAYSYNILYQKLIQNKDSISNIFILGPSHHYYTKKCEVTQYAYYDTPLGNLSINTQLCHELVQNNSTQFKYMNTSVGMCVSVYLYMCVYLYVLQLLTKPVLVYHTNR